VDHRGGVPFGVVYEHCRHGATFDDRDGTVGHGHPGEGSGTRWRRSDLFVYAAGRVRRPDCVRGRVFVDRSFCSRIGQTQVAVIRDSSRVREGDGEAGSEVLPVAALEVGVEVFECSLY